MLSKNGVPENEDLAQFMPSAKRLAQGPVAIIECFQEIPCDPCAVSCKKGAILPFDNINALPAIDFELCDGCGLCVAACPGLAIFVIDYTYNDDEAILKIPHEFVPLPEKGEIVALLNRNGNVLGEGKIIKALRFKDKTNVVWITAPKEIAMDIRAIAPAAYEYENPLRKLSVI